MKNISHPKNRINASKQARMHNAAVIMYIVGAVLFILAAIIGFWSGLVGGMIAVVSFVIIAFGMETDILSNAYEE